MATYTKNIQLSQSVGQDKINYYPITKWSNIQDSPDLGIPNDSITTAKIVDGNVTAVKLASNSVETMKINNTAVTADKIATNAVISDKINNSAVTNAKLANMDANTVKGNVTSASAVATDVTMPMLNDQLSSASITAKATPVDADSVIYTDSQSSSVAKRATWTNIKAFLKTYFDTLFVPLTRTVNGKALSANITITAADISAVSVANNR